MKSLEPLSVTDQQTGLSADKMSAIVQSEYGSPDVLSLEKINKPVVQDTDVLVRIHATSVHAGDWHLMRGTPFLIRLMFGGLLKPKNKILGTDMAGQVEAVGKEVTQFQPGDEVFGDLSESGFGAFAEYTCAPEKAMVLKPSNITFEEAATVPVSALAALQALRDVGQIQAGQKVLINGASGGVGSFAVQLAKVFGADVTGVCSTQKVAMVQSLGADHVIDYTQEDITNSEQRYDLILDTAAFQSVSDYKQILSPDGTYVLVGGSTARFFQVMLFGTLIEKMIQRKVKFLTSAPNQKDLTFLSDLLASGKIKPFIDQRYTLREIPNAIRYVEERQVQGKVAISI